MSDRPILFSAPMVRALLDGRKTQTRRVLRSEIQYAEELSDETIEDMELRGYCSFDDADGNHILAKPPIWVRDRLWVRETWRCNGWATDVATIFYRSSEGDGYTAMCEQYAVADKKPMRVTSTWRPGIHMPRWASRLTLTVTEVRVERLQDISEADALAEGVVQGKASFDYDVGTVERDWFTVPGLNDPGTGISAVDMYSQLWTMINGPDAWHSNPWVAAYTFTVESKNIDEVPA